VIAYFGDGSVRGWSLTQLGLFRYTLTDATLARIIRERADFGFYAV